MGVEVYPRTLIISANSLSTHSNNGKMMASFFRHYPVESLAQIYIWPEYPNNPLCGRYYRITDMDMLRGWFGKEAVGNAVECHESQQDENMPSVFKSGWKDWPIMRLSRELVWTHDRWGNDFFWEWVDDFAPQIIFFASVNILALYRIAKAVAKRYACPLLIYITDDYFLPRWSFSPSFHVRRLMLKRSMEDLLHNYRSRLLTVSPYMQDAYRGFFKKDSELVYHCVVTAEEYVKSGQDELINVAYVGAFSNGRKNTLRAFRDILLRYPQKNRFRFSIYSREVLTPRELRIMEAPPYLNYCGALDAQEVQQKLAENQVLMHIESFRYKNRKETRLSFSTKLMEYFAVGRPVFMIGPREVSSMRFLREKTQNITACTLNDKDVFLALDRLLDPALRESIGRHNFALAADLLSCTDMDRLLLRVSSQLLDGAE